MHPDVPKPRVDGARCQRNLAYIVKHFNEYLGGGYWIYTEGKYRAIIKITREGWYGGACTNVERSVPLHGPYAFKRTARKVALKYLSLIRENDPADAIADMLQFGGRL